MKHVFLPFLAALSLVSAIGAAQSIQLADDISSGALGSTPISITSFGDSLFFVALDAGHGNELYKWQGMGNSSLRLTDVAPGTLNGINMGTLSPMIVAGSKLYFTGFDGTHGVLVYHDKTHKDTVVWTSPTSSVPRALTYALGKLYFIGDSSTSVGRCLMAYDGINPAEVVLCKGLERLSVAGNWSPIIIPYKNKLYFSYDDRIHGTELGSYDPATGQGGLLADINTSYRSPSSTPRSFVAYQNMLYFVAGDSAFGDELYRYDGVQVKRITDVNPGPDDGIQWLGGLGTMASFNGCIYFPGIDKNFSTGLWKYDVAKDTAMLAFSTSSTTQFAVYGIYAAKNNVFFYTSTGPAGNELYRYDGTKGYLVGDLNPGSANGAGRSNLMLHGDPGYVYFSGDNGTTGFELYRVRDTLTTTGIAIENVAWGGSVVAYPNPAQSVVTLQLTLPASQSVRIILTNLEGRTLWSSGFRQMPVGKSEVRVPMQQLPGGQYFYRLLATSGKLLANGAIQKF